MQIEFSQPIMRHDTGTNHECMSQGVMNSESVQLENVESDLCIRFVSENDIQMLEQQVEITKVRRGHVIDAAEREVSVLYRCPALVQMEAQTINVTFVQYPRAAVRLHRSDES